MTQKQQLCSNEKLIGVTSAIKWLDIAVTFCGGGFHPDTRGSEYIDVTTGEPTFYQQEKDYFDDRRQNVFNILGDELTYTISLLLVNEKHK